MTTDPSAKQPPPTEALLLAEYNSLKAEQLARIGFRDNLLYVTLGVVGALCAYALGKDAPNEALLLVPWACFILGWTYVNNNRKVTDIGSYIRDHLAAQAGSNSGMVAFDWERKRRKDGQRVWRKRQQLLVDLVAFCLSSLIALAVFVRLEGRPCGLELLPVLSGAGLTLLLAWWIWRCADLGVDA